MNCSTPGLPVHHQLPELTKPTFIKSVMPSSHLILCRPLLLPPPIPPSIRVFSNESTLHMRWPKYWSFSFSIIPSKAHPGLISFRMDWLDEYYISWPSFPCKSILTTVMRAEVLYRNSRKALCKGKNAFFLYLFLLLPVWKWTQWLDCQQPFWNMVLLYGWTQVSGVVKQEERNLVAPYQILAAFLEFLYNTSALITVVRILLHGKEGQEI